MGDAGPEPGQPPDWTSKLVVGGYGLEVGAFTGTSISFAEGSAAKPTERLRLVSAIEQEDADEEPRHRTVDKIEISAERTETVTEQVARADALWIDFAAGRLDIAAVNNGIDSLLAVLERLAARSDRFDDQLRLARSLSRLLAVALRWIELVRSLRGVLRGAEKHGDVRAKAWALHELGTLRLAARDFARADEALSEASELRRQLGDRAGMASTDRNLHVLCRTLRQLVRDGLLVDRGGLPDRFPAPRLVKRLLSHTTLLITIMLLVLGLTGVVLASTLGGAKARPLAVAATLSTQVKGQGHVVSRPVGIACPTHCTARFRPATPVSLNATAGARSSFAGWRGACSGRGACQVTAAGTRTVLALFVLQPAAPPTGATLTVRAAGNGSIRSNPKGIDCPSTCTATFPVGQTVTLTATPATGSAFTSWSGDCAGTAGCTLVMGANHSVLGSFSATPRLTVAITGAGSITSRPAGISCPGTCNASFPVGTAVTLVPHTSGASSFMSWAGDCTGRGSCAVTMNRDRSIGAAFSESSGHGRVTIMGLASPSGDGGVSASSSSPGESCSSGTCTLDSGGDVTLTATPNKGYAFNGWSGACAAQTGPTCVLNDATSNATATAGFVQQRSQITVSGSPSPANGGSVAANSSSPGASCSGASCTLDSGGDVSLTATPNKGYGFNGWSGACSGQTGPTCELNNVTSGESATAGFVLQFTVGGSAAGEGTISASSSSQGASCSKGSCTVVSGGSVTLTATPNSGYQFDQWDASGPCAGRSETCTIDNITMNESATATFGLILYRSSSATAATP